MKPLTQTIVSGNGQTGNCLQTAVASLLEMPLERVPHFVKHARNQGEKMEMMKRWLLAHGYELIGIASAEKINDKKLTKGLPQSKGCVVAFGISPRNYNHAVIYKDGKLLHDVHPSRAGLSVLNGFYIIEKKEFLNPHDYAFA